MVHLRCDYNSTALGMCSSMMILLPDTIAPSEAAVIYLFHGLSDNCTGWTRLTSVELYAREHNAAIIMPEVQRSFYADMASGVNYFTYVREELPAFCRRTFGLSDRRAQNFVMGLSMGGYGALKCALTSPERYAGCAAFSAVTDLAARRRAATPQQQREFDAIFGPGPDIPPESELYRLCEAAGGPLPRFYLSCGEEDALYTDSERMASALRRRGGDVCFEHWHGGHEWRLWDRSLERAMKLLLPATAEGAGTI